MAKTAAERQAEYRARRTEANDNGESRINMWIDNSAYFALKRLAARYGVTQQAIIEKLLNEADAEVVKTLDLDTPEWDEYYRRSVTA